MLGGAEEGDKAGDWERREVLEKETRLETRKEGRCWGRRQGWRPDWKVREVNMGRWARVI